MRKMIHADLRRILRKKGFYIDLGLLFLFQVRDALSAIDSAATEILNHDLDKIGGSYLMIAGIFAYLAIFSDDAKSNAPVNIIGRGMRRDRLIIGKMIDCGAVISLLFLLMTLWKIFLYKLMSITITDRQIRLLILYTFLCVLKGIGVLAICLLVQLITGSTAVAIIAYVMLTMFASMAFKYTLTAYHINIYRFTPDGLVEDAYANLAVGNFPWQLIPLIAIYICGVVWLSYIVYQRKELEL